MRIFRALVLSLILVLLAFVAAATDRMLLGTGIIIPQRNPLVLAKQCATLDVLSNGRCEFGAGRGTAAYVVEGLGFDSDADHARQVGREALEAVVQMLEQEHFPGYKSAHFDLTPRQVVPPAACTPT